MANEGLVITGISKETTTVKSIPIKQILINGGQETIGTKNSYTVAAMIK